MNVLNVFEWLHRQSCDEWCFRVIDEVATQRAGDVFLHAFRTTWMQCHVAFSLATWMIWVVVSSLACSCNIRNRQRPLSDKVKMDPWISSIVAMWIAISCMWSRAINISCTGAQMSRDSALVKFFYMRLEKHLCKPMTHELLVALAV